MRQGAAVAEKSCDGARCSQPSEPTNMSVRGSEHRASMLIAPSSSLASVSPLAPCRSRCLVTSATKQQPVPWPTPTLRWVGGSACTWLHSTDTAAAAAASTPQLPATRSPALRPPTECVSGRLPVVHLALLESRQGPALGCAPATAVQTWLTWCPPCQRGSTWW
jgi:hypothetical protein